MNRGQWSVDESAVALEHGGVAPERTVGPVAIVAGEGDRFDAATAVLGRDHGAPDSPVTAPR